MKQSALEMDKKQPPSLHAPTQQAARLASASSFDPRLMNSRQLNVAGLINLMNVTNYMAIWAHSLAHVIDVLGIIWRDYRVTGLGRRSISADSYGSRGKAARSYFRR
jgi:hypothetical protein